MPRRVATGCCRTAASPTFALGYLTYWAGDGEAAFAKGDTGEAISLATAADSVGTESGVERELPVARCILARALLAEGDIDAASAAVELAFAAADSMSTDSCFALCLETAALVGRFSPQSHCPRESRHRTRLRCPDVG